MVNWKKIIGRNYANEGNEENNMRDLIVSMQHQKEMVLTVLVAQEEAIYITLSSTNGKLRGTRNCVEMDMESSCSMRDLFAVEKSSWSHEKVSRSKVQNQERFKVWS